MPAETAQLDAPRLRSRWGSSLRRWLPLDNRSAMVGLAIYVVLALVAIFADHIATQDPTAILFDADYNLAADQPPSAAFVLGTTTLGRDIFSQLVYGTRSAMFVGLITAFIVVGVGTVVGLVAGYFGGVVDAVLMRIADIAFGIPFLPFVVVLCAFLSPTIWHVILGICLILWRDTARVIRSQVLTLRSRAYIEAARVSGSSALRILLVHIAPNILPIATLYGSISIGWAILTEASVAFIGFGDPNSISWGYMLQDAYASQALSHGAYNWFIPPGLAIVILVGAGFLIGRGYEDLLFPKLRD